MCYFQEVSVVELRQEINVVDSHVRPLKVLDGALGYYCLCDGCL
jgi:hypothetical protein